MFFWIEKNRFFHLWDIPGSENSFSEGNVFLANFSFRYAETNFLSSRKSIVLLGALLEFGGSNLYKKNLISACGNWFFGKLKLIFSIFQTLLLVKGTFVWRKRIFKRIFYSVCWRRVLCLVKTVFSYLIFFYKWKLLLKLLETNLFEKDFVPVERNFPPSGNCFLLFHSSSLQWPFLISK